MSEPSTTQPTSAPGIILTPEEKRRQRQRNIAIAFGLGALCVLFWVVTLVKGSAILQRPM
ncbi:CoxF protein [Phreatobacter sp.]|uniref:CoxF protein n=1 Tax=Phreatobacter sp. TaxID=1966341 RepID=UPI0022C0D1ED|nr:CoxF protein [Phreatobacter sp.]MCZ8313351.1 CoxF protein [Phreatobacter sp.]